MTCADLMVSEPGYISRTLVCRWYWDVYAPQVRTAQQLTELRIAQLGSAPHLVVAQAVCDMLGNSHPPSVEQTVVLQSSVPGISSTPPLPPPDRDAYIQRHGMFLVCGESVIYTIPPRPALHRSMHRGNTEIYTVPRPCSVLPCLPPANYCPVLQQAVWCRTPGLKVGTLPDLSPLL